MAPERARRLWIAAAVVGLIVAAVALLPRPVTTSSGVALTQRPREEDLVRVPSGGTTLVFDKQRGWFPAKGAEWFPSFVTRVVPADYVELPDGTLTSRNVTFGDAWWK